MRIVVDADGNVLMTDPSFFNFTVPEGAAVVTLTDDQSAAFGAVAQPNGGVTFIDGVFAALPVPSPSQCTPLQARRALRQLGVIDAVNAYVATQPGDVQDAWEYASVILKTDPLIVAAGAALSLNLDDLFTLAATFA